MKKGVAATANGKTTEQTASPARNAPRELTGAFEGILQIKALFDKNIYSRFN
jgi:hypothetical protein